MNQSDQICPCGDTEAHVIAKRVTFDGKRLSFWSDGDVTQILGYGIKGLGQPRSAAGFAANLEASKAMMPNVALYTFDELRVALKQARKLARRGVAGQDLRTQVREAVLS